MQLSELAEAFLDDFFIEADEHLQTITRHLLFLEQNPDAAPQEAIIQELFRSYHTLKGLCGMAGLSAAAKLSHALESVLRRVQRGEMALTPEALDALVRGTEKLAAIIATFRERKEEATDIEAEVSELEKLAAAKESSDLETGSRKLSPRPIDEETLAAMQAALSQEERERLQRDGQNQRTIYLVQFDPHRQDAQGVTVDQVRAWLEQEGDLIKATPIVGENSVRFAFLWAGKAPPNAGDPFHLDWRPASETLFQSVSAADPTTAPVSSNGGPAPPQKTQAKTAAPRQPVAGAGTMRVDISRLDEIMRHVGDLVVSRSRLRETIQALDGQQPELRRQLLDLDRDVERQLRRLREAVMRARMAPLADAFSRMPLVIRDLARAQGKEVRLEIEGERAEIDKALVDRLFEPLQHLVRNAVIHGIEPPEEREALGKPRQGRILLAARPEGNRMAIVVADDGRGIDPERVAERAAELGRLSTNEPLSDAEILEIICRPGVSTKKNADLGAGRGVGMDVVRDAVRRMGGVLNMRNTPGKGVAFIMHVPLTLAIIDALLVQIGDERYAVPQTSIEHVIEVDPARIVKSAMGEFLPYGGNALPVLRLDRILDAPPARSRRARVHALLSGGEDPEAALLVDGILGMREIVVRTLDDPLLRRTCATGAAELGDGSVVLILDIPHLLRGGNQKRDRTTL